MKTKWTFFQICLAALLLPAAGQAQFDYTVNGNAVTITKYTGSGGAVVIPNEINNLPVTTVGEAAFENTGATSVMIPGTVTSIGTNAFYECALSSVTIPSSVTFIGDAAFLGTRLTNVTIPSSITSLSQSVFGGCPFLAHVTIPTSVTNIGDYAFASCGKLTSITLPNSITHIGIQAFSPCGLTSITIPASVTSIGEGPFAACPSLKTITVVASNPDYSSVGGVLFNKAQTALVQYPTGVTGSYAIPGSVTALNDQAFFYALLTTVTIPNSVTSIGGAVFQECANITSITIPHSVTSIGIQAFEDSGLTSIIIPNSLTSLSEDIFSDCRSLSSVTIPSSVTSIGDYAFESCVSLASIAIPSSVTNLGTAAFSACALTSINIPDSVISIGGDAFSFTRLSTVIIPGNVTSIGSYAFEYCLELSSISIPASVSSIGNIPFLGCSNLPTVTVDASNPVYSASGGLLFNKNHTALIEYLLDQPGSSYTIPGSVTHIADYAFYLSSLTNVILPNGLTSIGEYTFDSSDLTSITIPASVVSLGDFAFAECGSLAGLYFQGNPPALGGPNVFFDLNFATKAYYLAGAQGWGSTYGGLPTVMLGQPPQPPGVTGIGVVNNQFGFAINGTNTQVFVVEATTNLAHPNWQLIQTNTLNGPSFAFTDAQSRNYSRRFYRLVPIAPVIVPFTYAVSAGTITITGYTGSNSAVTIPNMIAGLPVTSIGDHAFYLSSLTSVTIPNSITSIGDDAFDDCTGLTSITIPSSVTSIGDFAFSGSSSLATVYFYGNAPSLVGSGVFSGVHAGATVYYLAGAAGWGATYGGLPTVLVPVITGGSVVNNLFGFTINATNNMVITVEATASLVNPNWQPIQTNTLAGAAFSFTDSQWRNYAHRFYRLVSISTGETQPQFTYTTNNGSITITGYTGADSTVTIPSMLTGLPVTSIGDDAFSESSLTSVTIPNSVTTIGAEAFYLSALTSVTIPNSVTSIGDNAFSDTGLTSITIPGGLTSIGNSVFSYCSSLASVTLSSGLSTLGYGMFSGCASLSTITLPASVTSIGDAAFYQCSDLTGIYFLGNAPTLGGTYVFDQVNAAATVYYLSGATGWGATYGGLPTASQ